jgi:Arrestin (or S-antigen), C-terminal domain
MPHFCDSLLTDGVVRARGWLKGKVILATTEHESSLSIAVGELQVDLVGKEMAVVPPHGVMGGIRTLASCAAVVSTAPCSSKKKEAVVFEEHRVLHDFAVRPFTGGCATYTFSIYLPGTLPPSMDFEDMDGVGGSCSVQYRLTAIIAGAQQPPEKRQSAATEWSNALKTEHTLRIVGETLSTKKYPYILQPTCYPLKQSLLNSGHIIAAARVENTHVGKGTSFDFSLACRNKSHQNIQRIDIDVLEEIQWRTAVASASTSFVGRNNDAGQQNLYTMSRTVTLGSYKNLLLDGLQTESLEWGGDPSTGSVSEPPKVDVLTMAEMHNCLLSQRNMVNLRLPSTSRDSYTGKLIKVSHYLQITLVVKEKSGYDPVIKIPLKVFDPPIEGIGHRHTTSRENISTLASTNWQGGATVIDHRPVPVPDLHKEGNPFL